MPRRGRIIRTAPLNVRGRGETLYRSRRNRFNSNKFKRGLSFGSPKYNPLPMSRTVRLRYSDYGTLNSAGTMTGASFGANCLYDPRTAVGGHQPALFDLMATMYNHYVVFKAKCTCDFWTEDAGGNYGVIVGIKLDDDNAFAPGAGGVQDVMELPSPNRTWRTMRMNAGGEKTMTRVRQWFNARKFFGVKDVKDNRDQIGSLVTGDPAEKAYFCPFYGHPDGATDVAIIHYVINIEYLVNFSEPRDTAQN